MLLLVKYTNGASFSPDKCFNFGSGRPTKAKFWERNPLSVDLWTKEVFIQKMEYIHYNPVAAGLCIYPEDYKYSSAKFYESGEDEFGFLKHWMV